MEEWRSCISLVPRARKLPGICTGSMGGRRNLFYLILKALQGGEGLLNFNSWKADPFPRPGATQPFPVCLLSLASQVSPLAWGLSDLHPTPVPTACLRKFKQHSLLNPQVVIFGQLNRWCLLIITFQGKSHGAHCAGTNRHISVPG